MAGIITQQLLAAPVLQSPIFALVVILGWGYWRSRGHWYGIPMLAVVAWAVGLLWAGHVAQQTVTTRLDESLNRQRCVIQGRIQQVSRQTDALTRFVIKVDQLDCQGVLQPQVKRLRLSWYRPQQQLSPGETWRMSVRLKRPHGFSNPGLFDYSAWLAQHHIDATGYVDAATAPQRLATGGLSLNAGRVKLLNGLQNALQGHPQTAVIAALALGERSAISDQQWRVIRTSGTSHLLAISGLHIGLVGAFFWWLGSRFWRLRAGWVRVVPAPLMGAVFGWIAALGYALLSGFAVPAQRAMIMFSVAVVGTLLRREVFSRRGYLIALVLVSMWEPLAVTQAGFWLSFAALLVIGWCLVGRRRKTVVTGAITIQFVLWLAMLPLVMLFFGEASLIALPANLVAIPLVTLVVLPLALAGTALLVLMPAWAPTVLTLAADVMALTWQWLVWLDEQTAGLANLDLPLPGVISPWVALLAFAGALWLVAPRGFPARWAGLALWLPLAAPLLEPITGSHAPASMPQPGQFHALVVDVGQGLAVIVTTASHTLVYDTGARFSERFDSGRNLLVPLLTNQRRKVVDRLVISHGDNDHAGGVPGLLAEMPVKRIDSGTPQQFGADIRPAVVACDSGEHWTWDGVLFEYLHRPAVPEASDNNHSCVLRIGGVLGLLLPGDLESSGELQLLNDLQRSDQLEQLQARVMLVPHHGSNNASTRSWIGAVNPQLVVVSSGYANRFGHPHPNVIARYRAAGVALVNTATVGAVNLQFGAVGLQRWSAQRIDHPRYWD